jgi:hypothetical protein
MIWEIVHEYIFLSLCWMDITNLCLLDCYNYFCISLCIQLITRIRSSSNPAFYTVFSPLLDFSGPAGFGTWRIFVPLFWATCRLSSSFLLFWILELFCHGFYILCLPLFCWDIKGEYFNTVVFLYSVYPLSLWDKKGEYMLVFGPGMYL